MKTFNKLLNIKEALQGVETHFKHKYPPAMG